MIRAVAICDWLMSGQYRLISHFLLGSQKANTDYAITLMVKGWSNSFIARQFINMHLTYTYDLSGSRLWRKSDTQHRRGSLFSICCQMKYVSCYLVVFSAKFSMQDMSSSILFRKKRRHVFKTCCYTESCFLQFHNFWKLGYTHLEPLLLDQTLKVWQLFDSSNLSGLCFFN